MLTASPMSSMKISPPPARVDACSTSCTDSRTLMKKRVMRGSVTVTGPPSEICRANVGMTLPRLPSTLPKRTEHQREPAGAMSSTSCSPSHFE